MQTDESVVISADLVGLSAGRGAGVAPIEPYGAINSLRVAAGFVAKGGGFDKI